MSTYSLAVAPAPETTKRRGSRLPALHSTRSTNARQPAAGGKSSSSQTVSVPVELYILSFYCKLFSMSVLLNIMW